MSMALDLWSHQPLWFWWALGAVLIAAEIASMTTYLLWPGIAAFATGFLVLIAPSLDGRLALFLFAVLAVASTIAAKRFLPHATQDSASTLNRRSAQMLGRNGVAEHDFAGGRGAILIDDTRWSAEAIDGSAPKKADGLTVTGADGTLLQVRLAPPHTA